jgi:DNA-directed RNA polymerase subunit RPC12/RpoP
MSDAVPVSLFLTRRALCPGCGAPLHLQADAVVVECEYCGCESGVERRLRTVETELAGGVNPAEVARGRTRFIPAHAIARDGHAEAKCPGCGSPIDLQRAQDLAECAHCGSKSKVERRLAADADDPCDDTALDDELRAFANGERERSLKESLRRYKEGGGENPFERSDLHSDHHLLTLLTGPDSELLESTSDLLKWQSFNTRRECLFTRLLLRAEASMPKVADALFKHIDWAARTDSVSNQSRQQQHVRCITRSAARVFYRPDVSERLLYTLGTCQPTAMLKLLLDVAEWGLEHGHRQAADNALNAAARVLDKRERMYHIGRS